MSASTSRRCFLRVAGAAAIGFGGLKKLYSQDAPYQPTSDLPVGYGPLVPDPLGVLDLPNGFSHRVISKVGEKMDDGLLVPALHDGMAAFPGPEGKTILIRNHECERAPARNGPFGWGNELLDGFDRTRLYDASFGKSPPLGGTTTLVYNTRSQQLEKHFLSLAGTVRNCAGGPTPWGSWITCEETEQQADSDFEKDHGYNFEVPASANIGLADPVPLCEMGRFVHEAVAVDPKSGIVYETEDQGDGLIYRFIPNEKEKLAAGGRLQVLAIRDAPSTDTRNWEDENGKRGAVFPTDTPFDVRWIDIDDVDSPANDLRHRGFNHGAARFARGEGMWYGNGSIYFACTNGGPGRLGQIWRYTPSRFEGQEDEDRNPGRLELFVEAIYGSLIQNCDNLTVSPWGDLVVSEDGPEPCDLLGITPGGEIYLLARNSMSSTELAGVTFSPDGSTLFVNMQGDGITIAISGPWRKRG